MESLPHGYTNATTSDGRVVTKSYLGPDAAGRCAREAAALRALAGRLPVPPVLACAGPTLTAGFMPGTHGQDLIDAGLAEPVLRACGRMLRRIHAMAPDGIVGAGPHPPGQVLVHGDYGPNNLLLDPRAGRVTAILDWEWARAGDPVDDLAWCEWIVRTHHPAHAAALASETRLHADWPDNAAVVARGSIGDAEQALSSADVVVSEHFRHARTRVVIGSHDESVSARAEQRELVARLLRGQGTVLREGIA